LFFEKWLNVNVEGKRYLLPFLCLTE